MSEFSTGWLREIIAERFVGGREGFDRWLAEVERAAAEKALTDAAQLIADKSEAYAVSARRMHDDDEHYDSSRYFNYAAGLNMAVPVLRSRAGAYRQERKE